MSRFIFSSQNADGTTSLYSTDGTAAGTTDLQAARYGFAPGSVPPDLLDLGNEVLFLGTGASSSGNLETVYRSDGTAIGTSDTLIAGTGGSLSPTGLWAVGKTVLTSGATTTGQGLYASADGVNFSEIAPGLGVGSSGIVVSNGVGFFAGIDNGGNSLGLWRTDGTAAGTINLNTQTQDPYGFASAGKTTVFAASSTPGGATALWVTDGTANGTAQLQVPALSGIYSETSLVSLGGKVLFAAATGPDALNQATLWATDGTVGGTTEISSIGGVSLGQADVLSGLGDAVFLANYGIFITDGTAAGTTQIQTYGQIPEQFVVAGNDVIYLGASNNITSLFSYDASAKTTIQITLPSVNLSNTNLSVVGGQVIFAAVDASGTEAFFSTDGTQAGTKEMTLPAAVALHPTTPAFVAALPGATPPSPPGPVVTIGSGAQQYSAAAGVTVLAGSGNDTITATAGQVTVVGSSGSLAFLGGTGASSVSGGAGSSTIFGGAGGGYFDGGRGGYNVLISQGASGTNTSLTGGGAGDQIFGSAHGNDVLTAGAGRDSILGGSGHTTIHGGTTGSVIFTGGGSSVVFGGTGGADTVVGGVGSLNVSAQSGDAIFGGTGALNVTGSASGSGADSIVGGAGALIVNGQGANMLVVAGTSTSNIQVGNGASLIFAGSGSNSVTGSSGSLQVVLGSGATTATEGSGSAVYDLVKGAAGGTDMINGFRPDTDQIQLYGYQPSEVTVTSSGGSSLISLSDGTKIHIVGVTNLGHSIIV